MGYLHDGQTQSTEIWSPQGERMSVLPAGYPAVAIGGAPFYMPGDGNEDGSVDPADAALLADCLSGPLEPVAGACSILDHELDTDVDLKDWVAFANSWEAIYSLEPSPTLS